MSETGEALELHATAVAIDGLGVLLRGRSGTGKSDLALRLVDQGARLISDDRVRILRQGEGLRLRPPARLPAELEYRIEVRGLGIFAVPGASEAPLVLVADLLPGRNLDRLPGPQSCRYLGLERPLVMLDPFLASAPAKLRLAARALPGAIIPPP
jgi:HPr kinase/phosphorylase